MSQVDRRREHLIETYRKKAKHYDITSRLYPVPGYPQRAQRLRPYKHSAFAQVTPWSTSPAGTGLNFPMLEKAIGPGGRIIGVDLTDAMLAHAQHRIEANGWSNVSLVQSDAAGFDFPAEVDATCPPTPCHRCPSAQRSSPTVPRPSPKADAGPCGSQGSRQHARVANAARNRNGAAFRLDR